jgi:hypothetical protein
VTYSVVICDEAVYYRSMLSLALSLEPDLEMAARQQAEWKPWSSLAGRSPTCSSSTSQCQR